MKILKLALLINFFLLCIAGTNGQQLKENEIVVIGGEKYVLHQVRTGETIFSISRDFKVDRSVLILNNPKIEEGLKIGEILKIPYKTDVVFNQAPVFQKGDPSGFLFHTIESRKETPYFIAKEYGVTVEELYAYNPTVNKFRKGTKLRIPQWESPKKEAWVENEETAVDTNTATYKDEVIVHTVKPGETVYSISKKYDIPESEIIFHNPGAKDLKAGAKIYLPGKVVENQDFEEKPEDTKEGLRKASTEHFTTHIIESGETLWGISHKYNITEEELVEWNPVLKTAFPAGVIIKIPMPEIIISQATSVNEEAFYIHFVESGETLYRISEKYNIPIPEIIKFNPVLENRNLVFGETILIPKIIKLPEEQFADRTQESSFPERSESFVDVEMTLEIPEDCTINKSNVFSGEVRNVALFLPLFLEANDTLNREFLQPEFIDSLYQNVIAQDTSIEQEISRDVFKAFYGNSENFLQFYEGVVIAVDSMQKEGMNINLRVFDTQNDAASIRKYIYESEFLETDLIIGPVYPQVQKEVAEIAAKNRIPMVSPFASRSNIIDSNSHYFQINPSQEYIASKTAEMVAEEHFNSNFIVLRTSDYEATIDGRLVDLIQEKLFNSGLFSKSNGVSFSFYDFKNEGPFGLRRILSADKENVVFIPSSVEGELSVAISNLNNLSDDFSITLIASNNYQQRYPSIEVAHFHNLKMKYIYPYWMDYNNNATINFIEKFKSNFNTEPNNFGVQGFDAAFYFLNALNFWGKNFNDCLPFLHINLVQGNYHFEKVSKFGGYMNQGVSVISYNREFDVLRKRVKGQPRLIVENK